nr:anon-23da protein [Cryptococcus depauperatus CBS 7841]
MPSNPSKISRKVQSSKGAFQWSCREWLGVLYRYTVGALLSQLALGWFVILASIGMARWERDVVRVIPANPGYVRLRDGVGAEQGRRIKVNEWVGENVGSLRENFMPAAWLPNGHLQTFFTIAGNFANIDKVHYIRTYLRLPDGGTIGLDTTPEEHANLPKDAPTVVVCHGLTGGSHESYVRNALHWVTKPRSQGGLGGRGVVMNSRGCAGVPLTSCQLYSAGTTMDLALSLHYLRLKHPNSVFIGLGFSLGASIVSRYLGEYGEKSILSGAVVLGCPWDLPAMSYKLENDWFIARVYSSALAKNVLRLFFRAYDQTPSLFDQSPRIAPYLSELKKQRKNMGRRSRLKNADDFLISKIGGPEGIGAWPFLGAKEYYDWASPRNVISGVKVPLLAINAFDDPVVDCTALPLDELKSSSHVVAAITGSGGHLGWFDGPFPLFSSSEESHRRWVLKPISEFISAGARDWAPPKDEEKLEVVETDGWQWVKEPIYSIPGLERVGWKVLKEGEVVVGEDDEGEIELIQGL